MYLKLSLAFVLVASNGTIGAAASVCTNTAPYGQRDEGCTDASRPMCVGANGAILSAFVAGVACVACVNSDGTNTGQDDGCAIGQRCLLADGTTNPPLNVAGDKCVTFCVNNAAFANPDQGCTTATKPMCVGVGGAPLSAWAQGEYCAGCVNTQMDNKVADQGCTTALPRCIKSNYQNPTLNYAGDFCTSAAGTAPPTATPTQAPSQRPSHEPSQRPSRQPSEAPVVMKPEPATVRLSNVARAPDTISTSSAGASQAGDNQVPYRSVNFIISLYGVFPSPSRRQRGRELSSSLLDEQDGEESFEKEEEENLDQRYLNSDESSELNSNERPRHGRGLGGGDPMVGQIEIFAGNFAPNGWAFCDGSLLPIGDNEALFAILGTTYGGDGLNNFALPDLRGRVPIHMGTGPGLSPRTLGSSGGTPTVTLSVASMPAHTHTVDATQLFASPLTATLSGSGTSLDGKRMNMTNTVRQGTAPLSTSAVGSSTTMNNMSPFLTLNFIIALQGIFPSRDRRRRRLGGPNVRRNGGERHLQGTEPELGEIIMFAGNFAPNGWASCNGQLLPINQNTALFSLLGTTFGGDGRVNFALPDLRGRTPIHAGSGFTLGQAGGSEGVTLTTSNLPAHAHTLDVGTLGPITGNSAVLSGDMTLHAATSLTLNAFSHSPSSNLVSTGMAGASQPVNNMMPYLVINFVTALQGIYPPRSRKLDHQDDGDDADIVGDLHNAAPVNDDRELGVAEPFVADIAMVPYNFAPRGWSFCNGQILSISQNTALFSLLGTTYGGDGRSTFALPDLQGRAPLHAGSGPGLPSYSLGQSGGAKEMVLTVQQIPAHAHNFAVSSLGNITTTLSVVE